jgi:hypothetical protein
MNVVLLEVKMSKEFTPSLSKIRLINGIPQIPIIVSQEQQIRSVMLEITIVAYKFGQEFEPLIRSQSENGQTTYKVPMNIQVGR